MIPLHTSFKGVLPPRPFPILVWQGTSLSTELLHLLGTCQCAALMTFAMLLVILSLKAVETYLLTSTDMYSFCLK